MPDKYSQHEVLHLSNFLMTAWDSHILSREEVRTDKDLLQHAERAMDALYDFYVVAGNKWIGEDE